MAVDAEHGTAKGDAYYAGVNEDLLALLPADARHVLDVGCGEGALVRALKERRPGVIVHGLDREAEALRIAARHLARTWQADLDRGLPDLDGPYDAILCGDVLEHLVDPWATLRALADHLAPDGRLLASIPNVRYYKVLRDLVFRGRFTYRERGILDATHLRFFTLASMHELFERAGLAVEEVRPRLGGRNLLAKGLDLFLGGPHHELRAVQFTLRGRKR